MANENRNRIPELVDLNARLNRAGEEHELRVDLFVDVARMATPEATFEVRLRQGYISLDFTGFELNPASRFGAVALANKVQLKHSNTRVQNSSAKGSLRARIAARLTGVDASAEASGELAAGKSTVAKTEMRQNRPEYRVQAAGSDRWRVREPGEATLRQDTYLSDEKLCSFMVADRANQTSVTARFLAWPMDMKVDIKSRGSARNLTVTEEKLLGIFLAKHMNQDTSALDGVLVLSELEIEDEK